MQLTRFHDRQHAGRVLAGELGGYAHNPDVVVLALPRGGVPVAYEVARALDAPLDVFVVRKLGTPYQEELAMGAIASGGVRVLNTEVINGLGISSDAIEAVALREQEELERRERVYRAGRPMPELEGRTVILVDDGIATGTTMRAAIMALKQFGPHHLVVAVAVAPPSTCDEIAREVDELVCPLQPPIFWAISQWYEHFGQTSDAEVQALLARAAQRPLRQPAGTMRPR